MCVTRCYNDLLFFLFFLFTSLQRKHAHVDQDLCKLRRTKILYSSNCINLSNTFNAMVYRIFFKRCSS